MTTGRRNLTLLISSEEQGVVLPQQGSFPFNLILRHRLNGLQRAIFADEHPRAGGLLTASA